MTSRRKLPPPLPDGYIRHGRDIYHVHGHNRDGTLNAYGPVVWDPHQSRYVAGDRPGYRALSIRETPRQLTLDGAA